MLYKSIFVFKVVNFTIFKPFFVHYATGFRHKIPVMIFSRQILMNITFPSGGEYFWKNDFTSKSTRSL